ncbi:MAG: cytochrome c3 family protein [Deltaproteobacteria bacterium]|nr:cytochrome c3 family protein [Deltaproteobacteria bacterium]
MDRPPAKFPHDKHEEALKAEDCKACHAVDQKLGILPVLDKQPERFSDDDRFVEFYHGKCIGCHERRRAEGKKAGPQACGECHKLAPPAVSERRPARHDYSLHFRHVKATAEPAPDGRKDRCDACHHVFDEQKKERVYKKGAEASCRDCHAQSDQVVSGRKRRSVRNASHIACINCHRETLKKTGDPKKSGPADCAGCHDAKRQAQFAVLKPEQIERLKIEKQPDRAWVETPKTNASLVPFDHKAHEPLTTVCRDCHHDTLKRCAECHELSGGQKGGNVTLEQAHHRAGSGFSCVGCHERLTSTKVECAGCHEQMLEPPGERACAVCHSGTAPAVVSVPIVGPAVEEAPGTQSAPSAALVTTPPHKPPDAELFADVKLAPLPKVDAKDFPEKITIDVGGKKYQPTVMPHLKIVKKLHDESAKSKLANRFHGKTEVLCAGCHHHHSPADKRPPPCRSCHGAAATAGRDMPSLENAFHRQCIGCHQQMARKEQGCTDCHKAEKVAEAAR